MQLKSFFYSYHKLVDRLLFNFYLNRHVIQNCINTILKATKCTFFLKNYHSYKQYNKLCIQTINSWYKTPFHLKRLIATSSQEYYKICLQRQ